MEALMSFQVDLAALKEPRGFIRIIQFVFAILAFATTSGFKTSSTVSGVCAVSSQRIDFTYNIDYPFNRVNTYTIPPPCTKENKTDAVVVSFQLQNASSSEFYVAVGVLSMLYALTTIGLYTLFAHVYTGNARAPFFDLIITGVLTFFWFVGWCAWVANVGNVKNYAYNMSGELKNELNAETAKTVSDKELYKFAGLTISLIFGFGNILLWGASCWFVYKETGFHKEPNADENSPSVGPPRQQVPPRV
jgi:hypothetical protein